MRKISYWEHAKNSLASSVDTIKEYKTATCISIFWLFSCNPLIINWDSLQVARKAAIGTFACKHMNMNICISDEGVKLTASTNVRNSYL